ncbi:MAG: DNA cytosine methyltransferase [Anaerolineales bacterium]|nr:DNA cytosine methyltransferase [Anaerolineales bacterium]
MKFLSLFSGIEAASVAWRPLGWQCVGVAEIDPFPCAVLAHHYPDVPNLGSVTDITDKQIAALGPIDVVVGGSPCQDLSVAGKRAGLAGERSGLFHEQLRIFHAARHLCGARFLVWENVPGAFSSHAGRDFAVVVGEMAGCRVDVPDDGWGTEGVALGEHGLVEWAVLDAQWFGVAQRRRRVFAVLDTGDWASRPPILLERDSLRGDSAPSREAGKDTAGSTGDGVARCITTGEAKRQDWETCNFVAGVAPTLQAGGNRTGGDRPPGTTVDTADSLIVAHPLRAEGFDASEDGTGRGTPLVPVQPYTLAIRGRGDSHDLEYRQDGTANALLTPNGGRGGIGVGAIAFDTTQITHAANRSNPQPGQPCHPLAAGAHAPAIAFMADDYKDGGYEECDTARPLTTSADRTRAAPIAMQAMAVRRLTPVECERLQGFTDGYTAITFRGKPAADGPRYKALGNSMAVPVMAWIGRQIAVAVSSRIAA